MSEFEDLTEKIRAWEGAKHRNQQTKNQTKGESGPVGDPVVSRQGPNNTVRRN